MLLAQWVTPYAEDEMYPAGFYPLHPRPELNPGIAQWTALDRPVADADVVVYYNFGITHVVRPEDWPVMPVEMIGFHLRPFGFFDENPAIDLPCGANKASREHVEGGMASGSTGAGPGAPSCCALLKAAPVTMQGSCCPRSKL